MANSDEALYASPALVLTNFGTFILYSFCFVHQSIPWGAIRGPEWPSMPTNFTSDWYPTERMGINIRHYCRPFRSKWWLNTANISPTDPFLIVSNARAESVSECHLNWAQVTNKCSSEANPVIAANTSLRCQGH